SQLGPPMPAFRRITEADDRKVPRTIPAQGARGVDCPQRDGIVDTKQGGNIRAPLKQLAESVLSALEAELCHILHQSGLIRHPAGLQSAPIAGELSQGGLWPRISIANETNRSMPQLQQMPRGAKTGILTIRRDDRDASDVPGQQVDDRDASRRELAERTRLEGGRVPQSQQAAQIVEDAAPDKAFRAQVVFRHML